MTRAECPVSLAKSRFDHDEHFEFNDFILNIMNVIFRVLKNLIFGQ